MTHLAMAFAHFQSSYLPSLMTTVNGFGLLMADTPSSC